MAKVEIWDSDTFPDLDDHLGTTYTDENGYFEITVSHGDPNGIDIYWVCFLDSPSDRGVRVEKPGFLGPTTYSYESRVWPNLQDGSYYLGHWTISGGAPTIYYWITNAWYYLDGEVGYQTPKVTTRWPSGAEEDGPGYDPDANKIHIPSGWENENFATVHEYGHRVMNAVYGYIPYGAKAPGVAGWFQQESDNMAWAEGWATFFSLLIMNTNLEVYAESHGVPNLPITAM